MTAHFCISNPCWICYPELKPKEMQETQTFFLPILPDGEEKIWKMRYKDSEDSSAPWSYWHSTDKPSEMLIKALREQGMHKLEIIN